MAAHLPPTDFLGCFDFDDFDNLFTAIDDPHSPKKEAEGVSAHQPESPTLPDGNSFDNAPPCNNTSVDGYLSYNSNFSDAQLYNSQSDTDFLSNYDNHHQEFPRTEDFPSAQAVSEFLMPDIPGMGIDEQPENFDQNNLLIDNSKHETGSSCLLPAFQKSKLTNRQDEALRIRDKSDKQEVGSSGFFPMSPKVDGGTSGYHPTSQQLLGSTDNNDDQKPSDIGAGEEDPVLPTNGTKTKRSKQNASARKVSKRPPDDGHNWRKYGEKEVKKNACPRSYYKCTHDKCTVKKHVEHKGKDGRVVRVEYNGIHNHGSDTKKSAANSGNTVPFNAPSDNNNESSIKENGEEGITTLTLDEKAGGAESRKRRHEDDSMDVSKVIIQVESKMDIVEDGYCWRKYGQKVVKGNPNPRSYYKCTTPGCHVRKHIERSPNNHEAVWNTYEGKHNHPRPAAKNSGHPNVEGSNMNPNPTGHSNSIPMANFGQFPGSFSSINVLGDLTNYGPFGLNSMQQLGSLGPSPNLYGLDYPMMNDVSMAGLLPPVRMNMLPHYDSNFGQPLAQQPVWPQQLLQLDQQEPRPLHVNWPRQPQQSGQQKPPPEHPNQPQQPQQSEQLQQPDWQQQRPSQHPEWQQQPQQSDHQQQVSNPKFYDAKGRRPT